MSKKKAVHRIDSPAQRPAPDPRALLDRILDVPQLAHVVPRLQPEVLHRLIQRCGLEDCGELVALATPDQLARVFDLDLWRAGQPGPAQQFDPRGPRRWVPGGGGTRGPLARAALSAQRAPPGGPRP